MAREFLLAIVEQAREQRLLSKEHFSVDGTLLEAWASVKSFRPRDEVPPSGDGSGEGGGRNREVDFRGERRRNETHRSTTDPNARLARKGKSKEARLCFGAHVLMDNRGVWWWMCATPQPTAPGNGTPRWRCWRRRRVPGASLGRRPWLRYQRFHQGMPQPEGNTPCCTDSRPASPRSTTTTAPASLRRC